MSIYLTEVGITKPSRSKEGMVMLNVGGSRLTFHRSVLEGKGEQQGLTWALGTLCEAEWDKRVPRDSDGRIVLDESPTCPRVWGAREEHDLAPDDKPELLYYTARVLGLRGQSAPFDMPMRGGPNILEPHETKRLTAIVQGWCPGHPGGLELLYRASRDGWSARSFDDKCRDGSPSTISLPFSGFESRADLFTISTIVLFSAAPGNGMCDLRVVWKVGAASTVQTKNLTQDVQAESRLLALNGRGVVDIETFRLCYCRPTDALSSAKPKHHFIGDIAVPTAPVRSRLLRMSFPFGRLIADALMEEIVLQEANNELAVAEARTTACATALVVVYGPDVAKGREEEDVVELSVCGTRVTRMCSTLRVCPGSTFATQFLEDRWPATKKDLDDNGRRVIDCEPSVFSKVMDILRASWARGDDDQEANKTPRVTIKPCDRAEFEEFVDIYFKGCESLIMEYVESLGDEEADR
ncbi:unnamed protein product [Ectocarpus sp. CCAP 1310/34]|nr:unnamed protein product [Ectocarpus sp. CCAP 1310/34]